MKIIGSKVEWTRDCRPRWLLEELGVPFERERIDLFAGGGRTSAHRLRHPLGKVPVLELDGWSMIESGAMVLFLAEQHGGGRMIPPAGTRERALCYQWAFAACTTVEPPATRAFASAVAVKGREGAEERLAEAKADLHALAPLLEPALDGRPFVVGDRLTVADILLGSSLHWAQRAGALGELPASKRYYLGLAERPAFRKTYRT